MTEENTEICGFLDVKYLGGKYKVQKVKKRTLASWKVWKRHWCSIKKLGPGLGVKVQLDYGISSSGTASPNDHDNSVTVPSDAIICRTQSRSKQFAFGIFPTKERKPLLYLAGNLEIESQRWMANIRQLLRPRRHQSVSGSYSVSLIDNAHSRASGLTGTWIVDRITQPVPLNVFLTVSITSAGLYGDLVASTMGICIRDVCSGEIIETFEWKELDQFHLITAGRPEDVKCICVMHTSKEFRGGIGELHAFCLDSGKLLQDLVTKGRGPRKRVDRKVMSLSEGDLRISSREPIGQTYPIARGKMELKMLNRNRESSVGLEGATPRMCNKATEHVYQPIPDSVPNTGDNLELPNGPHSRRISNISVASGIYEEISDEADRDSTSNFYMNQFFHNHQSEEPPPLPPRQRCASESMMGVRFVFTFISDQCYLIVLILCVLRSRGIVSVASNRLSVVARRNVFAYDKIMDNCIYVPMSPRLRDIALHNLQTQVSTQESDYVIMR